MKSSTVSAQLQRVVGWLVLLVCVNAVDAQQAQTTSSNGPAHIVVAPRNNVDMLSAIEKRGKLRVGVSEIVPWTMHNKKGELVGFEIDVARKLARDLHVEVEFYPDEFRYLIPDLLANRFDIVIAGFSIEASRALLVNFSEPYNVTDVTIAANTRLAGNLETLDALNKPGITIGVIEGMTSEDLAALAFPKAVIHTYTEDSSLFNDLLQGKLSAAVADSPRLDILAKLYPGSITLPPVSPLGTFPAAFAIRRGDMDFINYLNSWIAARTADKWLDSHRTYWFKTTDWANTL
jgi:polar amino acid transport system substrate-binding protein